MLAEPNCYKRRCVHFIGVKSDDDSEENERPVCKAFPDGIPDEIAYGDNLHLKPYLGDHGIQFERESLHLVREAESRGSRFVETEDNPTAIIYDENGVIVWPPELVDRIASLE